MARGIKHELKGLYPHTHEFVYAALVESLRAYCASSLGNTWQWAKSPVMVHYLANDIRGELQAKTQLDQLPADVMDAVASEEEHANRIDQFLETVGRDWEYVFERDRRMGNNKLLFFSTAFKTLAHDPLPHMTDLASFEGFVDKSRRITNTAFVGHRRSINVKASVEMIRESRDSVAQGLQISYYKTYFLL